MLTFNLEPRQAFLTSLAVGSTTLIDVVAIKLARTTLFSALDADRKAAARPTSDVRIARRAYGQGAAPSKDVFITLAHSGAASNR